jgi:hypothetical protein
MSEPESGARPAPTLLDRLLSSEKALLLIVPFVGYLVLFVFQAGYLSYFSIPWQLMGFQLTDILVAGIVIGVLLLAALLLLWSLLPLVLLAFRRWLGPAQLTNLGFYLPLALAAFLALVALLRQRTPLFWVSLFLCLWSLGIVVLMIRVEHSGRLRRAGEEVAALWTGTLIGDYWTRFSRRSWLAVLPIYLLLLLLFTLEAGHIVASQRGFFRVTNSSPETVVVFQTEERVILKPFDRSTKELDGSYRVLSTGDIAGIEFRGETVGPFVLKEVAPSSGPATTPVLSTPAPSP